ncbi:MAG: peptidyl-prolyl cis-trans isomerase [Roseburia sp.]
MRRIRAFLVCSVLCVAMLFSGCQIGGKQFVFSGMGVSRQVFEIGGRSCSTKEARVYLANYQNIYGTAYGLDLWQHDFGDDALVDYVKNVALAELTRVYCMDLLAESRGITLTEEEKKKTEEAGKEYYESLSREERAYMDVSKSDVKKYYMHYALAAKLYSSLTDGINEEVSDDEARVMEIMQIFVTDSGKAWEISAKLSSGDDFVTVANNYNELATIQVTIARDDVPPAVEEIAFAMDNNEISEMIAAENGYYFIKCLNKYNVELTEANKSNIVEKREKAAFDDVYNEYVSSLTSSINEEVWESITLDTSGAITTNSFFDVFFKYCSEI